MTAWVGTFIEHIQDLPLLAIMAFFFLSGGLESTLQIWPGTTTLIFGGCMTSMGIPAGWLVIFLPFLAGESIGAFAVHEVGSRMGERVLQGKIVSRLLSPKRQGLFKGWVQRYGAGMLPVAKFVGGANTTAILIAGIMGIPRRKAYPYLVLAGALHNVIFFVIGLVIGGSWQDVLAFVGRYTTLSIWLGILAATVYAAYRILSARKENRTQNNS